jgi:predicted permease
VALDERAHTIVGVLPEDFRFLDEAPDVLTAWSADPSAAPRGAHDREALARLLPGVTAPAATEAVRDVARSLQAEHPGSNEGWLASVEPVRDFVLGDVARQASLVLAAAVGFLMLMACANVANLLLARAGARQSEMAVRVALGAGRGRLVRQLLTESVVLALIGGLAGLAVAEWGRRFIVAGMPENLPPVFDFSLDARVLAYAAALTLGSVAVFGLVPALRTARPAPRLRAGHRVGGGGRLAGALVVGQTALAVVLLVAGSVLVRSVVAMASQDFGWDADRVLYVRVTPPESRYRAGAELTDLYRAVEERLEALPGVEGVGAIQSAPLQGSNWGTTILLPGSDQDRPARVGYVSPGYFEAMGIDLVAGRGPHDGDGPDGARVVVVNEAFVRGYLPGVEPVGATVLESDGDAVQVVGVVADHVERGIDRATEPALYRPLAQNPVRSRTLVVRAAGDPGAAVAAVREAVWSVDGELAVWDARTLADVVTMRVGGFRLIAELMGAFAVLALVLAAVGIYGVTAHGVGQRRHEIGVRMALGADRTGVRRMVVAQGMRRSALGLVLGAALALPLAGALGGLTVGVDPRDPRVFGLVLATLAGVALLASWLPARRASGVDPVRALAAE